MKNIVNNCTDSKNITDIAMFHTLNCVYGGVHRLPNPNRNNPKLIKEELPLIFQFKYENLLILAKRLLNIKNSYMVLHWRRGDQLKLRCEPIGDDNSLNCANVKDFIKVE